MLMLSKAVKKKILRCFTRSALKTAAINKRPDRTGRIGPPLSAILSEPFSLEFGLELSKASVIVAYLGAKASRDPTYSILPWTANSVFHL